LKAMTYRYGQIESALIGVCSVPPEGVGAFRARLRHLRSLGIPKIEKVGSGAWAQFSFADAVTMRLALELSNLGVKPREIVSTIDQIKPGAISALANLIESDGEWDRYLFITFGVVIAMFVSIKLVLEMSTMNVASFAAVNISKLMRELREKLPK
jgi:hypothetical protein